MEIPVPEDNVEYRVTLGDTFFEDSGRLYRTIQCNKRSASAVETTGLAAIHEELLELEFQSVGADAQPFASYYRGSYKASKVECLLVYHGPEKGFTLERLSGSAKGLKPGKKPQDSLLNMTPSAISQPVNGEKTTKRKASSPVEQHKKQKVDSSFEYHTETNTGPYSVENLPRTVHSEDDSSSSSSEDDEMNDLISAIDNENLEGTSNPVEDFKEQIPIQISMVEVPTSLPSSSLPPSSVQDGSQETSLFSSSSSSSSSSSDSSSSSSDSESSDSDSNKQNPSQGITTTMYN